MHVVNGQPLKPDAQCPVRLAMLLHADEGFLLKPFPIDGQEVLKRLARYGRTQHRFGRGTQQRIRIPHLEQVNTRIVDHVSDRGLQLHEIAVPGNHDRFVAHAGEAVASMRARPRQSLAGVYPPGSPGFPARRESRPRRV